MRIRITFNLDGNDRWAIKHETGRIGDDSYEKCRKWIEKTVKADLEAIRHNALYPPAPEDA